MRRWLDQTVAWILAIIVASVIFGSGYSLIKYYVIKKSNDKILLQDEELAKESDSSHEDLSREESKETVHHESENKSDDTHEDKTEEDEHKNETTSSSTHNIHWSYEGTEGPVNWGKLHKDFLACSLGKNQSPVDVLKSERQKTLIPLKFDYKKSLAKIVNNGHAVQLSFDDDSKNFLSVQEKDYKLLQIHFHSPSEHKIEGIPYDMEIHLVHSNERGDKAVVGVLVEEGPKNSTIADVLSNVPPKEELPKEKLFNPLSLLPVIRSYYQYAGSLTTPPCTEGINWILMLTPIRFSARQIDDFIGLTKFNARPVQPLNDRRILKSWK